MKTDDQVSIDTYKNCMGFAYATYGDQMEANDHTVDLYDMLGMRHRELYEEIPVEVFPTEDDPYDSYEDMRNRVFDEGVLYVFDGGSHPEGMTHNENVMGRAVHDWFGHLKHDVDFSFEGEFMKWYHMREQYPLILHHLLFTEVVVQRAAVSWLPDGFSDPNYEQYEFEAPTKWVNMGLELIADE